MVMLRLLNLTLTFCHRAYEFRDAIGRCQDCSSIDGCGYCLSTLQCISGTDSGPSNGVSCPSWTFSNSSCPGTSFSPLLNKLSLALYSYCCFILFLVVPNCGDYADCYGCASQEQCAWCASENLCTTISEAFSRDCRGLVFEPPCPNNFVSGKPNRTNAHFCCVAAFHSLRTFVFFFFRKRNCGQPSGSRRSDLRWRRSKYFRFWAI